MQLSGLVDFQKEASAAVTVATAVPGVIPVKNDLRQNYSSRQGV